MILDSIFDEEIRSFTIIAGMFAAAWLAGFLAPGAPAGLGIREVLLVQVLSLAYPDPTALGATMILRVVTTLGDATAFVIGHAMGRQPRNSPI